MTVALPLVDCDELDDGVALGDIVDVNDPVRLAELACDELSVLVDDCDGTLLPLTDLLSEPDALQEAVRVWLTLIVCEEVNVPLGVDVADGVVDSVSVAVPEPVAVPL